jgi:hypothetical protein
VWIHDAREVGARLQPVRPRPGEQVERTRTVADDRVGDRTFCGLGRGYPVLVGNAANAAALDDELVPLSLKA